MRGRFKPWAKPYLEEHKEVASFDVASLSFPSNADLEIGGGKGDFAIAYCLNNPDRHLFSFERDVSIAGLFAKKAIEAKITNLTILPMDLDKAFEELKKHRFGHIFMNFSDPWPKKKHEKRRLTFAPRLLNIVSLLEDGGEIVMKTDNDQLYEFSKEQIALAKLKLIEDQPDYKELAENDYMTEYERNFRSVGKSIHRLRIGK